MTRRYETVPNRDTLMNDQEEELQTQAQASDLHTLERAKEILIELWTDGRIDLAVRADGERGLAGAIVAIERPDYSKIGIAQAQKAVGQQWWKKNQEENREF